MRLTISLPSSLCNRVLSHEGTLNVSHICAQALEVACDRLEGRTPTPDPVPSRMAIVTDGQVEILLTITRRQDHDAH